MDNAIKALEMAAGVLVGVMLMALVAYFFSNIGSSPQQDADILSAEQLEIFNKEYEVYDKNAMYGVDLISCLNKARSNNEKYVDGGGFLTGKNYGEQYIIDVSVIFRGPLQESLEIYRLVEGKEQNVSINFPTFDSADSNNNNIKLQDYKNKAESIFMFKPGESMQVPFDYGKDGKGYTNFDKETKTMLPDSANALTDVNDSKIPQIKAGDTYRLQDDAGPLKMLLDWSGDNMRQVRRNTNTDTLDIWSTAVWKTALYDLKKRRFKCLGIEYGTNGRVNLIKFQEI